MEDQDPLKKDFDTGALLQEHHKGISTLEDKVAALEKKLNEPKQLAKTLEDAADDSKGLEKLFSKIFCEMMKKDDAVKAAIKEKMESVDRDEVNALLKKFGGKIIWVIWTAATIIFGAWIGHKFGK